MVFVDPNELKLSYTISILGNLAAFTVTLVVGVSVYPGFITIPGLGIFVSNQSANDIGLLQHEFGHVLQHRKLGTPLWYAKVGLPSLLSAGMVQIKDNYDQYSFYSEINANDLSYKYFYKTFDWNKSSEWDMLRFPLYGALPEPLVAPNDVYNTLFY